MTSYLSFEKKKRQEKKEFLCIYMLLDVFDPQAPITNAVRWVVIRIEHSHYQRMERVERFKYDQVKIKLCSQFVLADKRV